MVHRSAAPYLSFLTIAASEHRHGSSINFITLLVEVHTGGLASVDTLSITEHLVALDHVFVDVDDYVAVDVSALIAAAIDVAAQQADSLIIGVLSDFNKLACFVIPLVGVPDKIGIRGIPSQRYDGQVVQIDFQTVLDIAAGIGVAVAFVLRTDDTALVGCVKLCVIVKQLGYISVITATHKFIVDIQPLADGESLLARNSHTTYVTATEEGTYIAGVGFIVCRITIFSIVKHDAWLQGHGYAFHIAGKHTSIGEVHATESVVGIVFQVVLVDHALTIVAQIDVVGNDIRTDFQLDPGVLFLRRQRSTVATNEDGTVDDGGVVGSFTLQTDSHLLGIGTESVKGLVGGLTTCNLVAIVEVAIGGIISQGLYVRIGVGTVATAIHVTIHLRIDTDGITTIDNACHVVTAIYIVNVSTAHKHSCRELVGEIVARQVIRRCIFTIDRRLHVSHTTAAIEVVDNEGGMLRNLHQQAFGTGHVTPITTAVEVAHLACQ